MRKRREVVKTKKAPSKKKTKTKASTTKEGGIDRGTPFALGLAAPADEVATPKQKHRLVVTFGGTVGVGKQLARLGVLLDRAEMNLANMDALFTNAQLACKLVCDPIAENDVDGQATTVDTTVKLGFVAHCKGFRVGNKGYIASLSTPKNDVDLAVLSQFAGRSGTLECKRTGSME